MSLPLLAAQVQLNPTSEGMPGAEMAQRLLDWGGQIALWGSLAAILIGAAVYGISQHMGNGIGASKGRVVALAGMTGAVLTGLAPAIVNALSSLS